MQGIRVDSGKPGDFVPGSYGRFCGAWACNPPGTGGGLGMLPDHTIVEHEDGTITVSPSILIHPGGQNAGWHGYLERGIWRAI